ncbi:MAG TPA: phytanoyl-CoA dioxygenase family protein [Pirellulales bacterium]|nr:phytanoyl-CoA dioxygenase family protein [Pirellulales bacterium]
MTIITYPERSVDPFKIATYHESGFLVLPGLFERQEIAELSDEAERLLERTDLIDQDNLRCRYQPNEAGGPCLFETFDPVIDIGPRSAAIAADRRIYDVLAQIYDDEACLFKDKLIFKPPGARGYSLHQDYIAWKNFPRSFVTVLVAIDEADCDNGCTVVYPGYHHHGCLTEEDGEFHEVPPHAIDETRAVPLELAPGDVAFFGCFTPHRSAPNRSSRWRRQLYLSYTARRDGGDLRQTHYGDFHAWLRKKYADYGKTNVYFR